MTPAAKEINTWFFFTTTTAIRRHLSSPNPVQGGHFGTGLEWKVLIPADTCTHHHGDLHARQSF